MRNRFDLYRRWFNTALAKEFLNLPRKQQEDFVNLVSLFLERCKRIQEEHKTLREKVIQITVTKVFPPVNQQEEYVVEGVVDETKRTVKVSYPTCSPQPKIGEKLNVTVFSSDGDVWYSSKEELITGRTT
jgi:hypothetical protein